jgi:hypothetical protein
VDGADGDMLWNGSDDEGTESEDGGNVTVWSRQIDSDIIYVFSILTF